MQTCFLANNMKPVLTFLKSASVRNSVKFTGKGGHRSWSQFGRFAQTPAIVRYASTSQFHKNVPATSTRRPHDNSNLISHQETNANDAELEKFRIFNQPLPRSALVLDRHKKPLEHPEEVIPSINELMAEDESLQSPDYFQVRNLFTVKDLFEARVHFGHKIGSMNSNMRPFIFGSRFDQVIFDLDKTAFHLRQALNFVAHIAYRSGIILFITRSAQTMHLVEKTAIECGEYVHTKHWETTILADSRTKFGGITRLPDAIIMLCTLDPLLNAHCAVKDAAKMLVPTVAIVDSNCNPNLITFPVPGNDDTPSAVELYCKLFKEAILRGKQKRKIDESKKRRIGITDGTTT